MLVLLGLATGARLGELLALRWSDLDLAKADGSPYRPDSVSTMFRKLVDRPGPASRGPRALPAPLGGELPERSL
jgi:integrase